MPRPPQLTTAPRLLWLRQNLSVKIPYTETEMKGNIVYLDFRNGKRRFFVLFGSTQRCQQQWLNQKDSFRLLFVGWAQLARILGRIIGKRSEYVTRELYWKQARYFFLFLLYSKCTITAAAGSSMLNSVLFVRPLISSSSSFSFSLSLWSKRISTLDNSSSTVRENKIKGDLERERERERERVESIRWSLGLSEWHEFRQ